MASGRTRGGGAGFTIKASELINKNPILKQDVTRPYLTPNDFDQIYSIIQKQSFSKDRVNLEKELLYYKNLKVMIKLMLDS